MVLLQDLLDGALSLDLSVSTETEDEGSDGSDEGDVVSSEENGSSFEKLRSEASGRRKGRRKSDRLVEGSSETRESATHFSTIHLVV